MRNAILTIWYWFWVPPMVVGLFLFFMSLKAIGLGYLIEGIQKAIKSARKEGVK